MVFSVPDATINGSLGSRNWQKYALNVRVLIGIHLKRRHLRRHKIKTKNNDDINMNNVLALNYIDDAFRSIGYKPSLIKKEYQFADLFSPGVSIRTVEMAVFGQEPLDYRSACFGVRIAEMNRTSADLARELKALGAPQIFILNDGPRMDGGDVFPYPQPGRADGALLWLLQQRCAGQTQERGE
jgi:hypothetical protein